MLELVFVLILVLFCILGFISLSNPKINSTDQIPTFDESKPKFNQLGIYSDSIVRIGVFQDRTEPPAYAEHLSKSDFTTRINIAGKYGGNRASYDHCLYRCPKCSELHELEFRHGDIVKCKKCNLISQTHGNGLDVWDS